MEQKPKALLSNLIGTPEVKLTLNTKSILLVFGLLTASVIIIFLAHAVIKKQ